MADKEMNDFKPANNKSCQNSPTNSFSQFTSHYLASTEEEKKVLPAGPENPIISSTLIRGVEISYGYYKKESSRIKTPKTTSNEIYYQIEPRTTGNPIFKSRTETPKSRNYKFVLKNKLIAYLDRLPLPSFRRSSVSHAL